MMRREAFFDDQFRKDLAYWVETDRRTALRAFSIVESTIRDPYAGIGKPEPLRHTGQKTWSRRLTQVHRIVYRVQKDRIEFLQARYHYR